MKSATIATFALAASLLVPTFALAGPQGAVLAWAPPAGASAHETVYDIYGLAGDAQTHLGTTQLTTFLASEGFERYLVKYHAPQGEGQVAVVCINYYYPDWPYVGLEIPCE